MTMVVMGEEPAQAPPAPAYAGLVTRTLAFALDIAIIDGIALITGAIVALGLSAFHLPHDVSQVLKIVAALLTGLWTVGYFAWFWSSSGQTPGDVVLGLRVLSERTGEPIGFRRGVIRVFMVVLSGLLLCLGFVMILFDRRRRALHDRLVHTVVVYHDKRKD